jgi:carbon-monoxide dehydrogenase medium subunit
MVEFATPGSAAEAAEILARHGPQARCLAGGTDLVIGMRNKGVAPRCLVDLKRIPELRQVTWDAADGGAPDLVIGAAVPLAQLARVPELRRLCPGLLDAIDVFGAYPLRTRASLGGNIGNASPAADTIPPLITLDAQVEVQGPGRRRLAPLESLLVGPGRTTLGHDELIAAVRIPGSALGRPGRYLRLGRRLGMELALVGVAVHRPSDGGVRIAFASVAPTPLRARQAEAALAQVGAGVGGVEAAVAAALREVRPITDVRASLAYRKHLVQVLLRRALRSVLEV